MSESPPMQDLVSKARFKPKKMSLACLRPPPAPTRSLVELQAINISRPPTAGIYFFMSSMSFHFDDFPSAKKMDFADMRQSTAAQNGN